MRVHNGNPRPNQHKTSHTLTYIFLQVFSKKIKSNEYQNCTTACTAISEQSMEPFKLSLTWSENDSMNGFIQTIDGAASVIHLRYSWPNLYCIVQLNTSASFSARLRCSIFNQVVFILRSYTICEWERVSDGSQFNKISQSTSSWSLLCRSFQMITIAYQMCVCSVCFFMYGYDT